MKHRMSKQATRKESVHSSSAFGLKGGRHCGARTAEEKEGGRAEAIVQ